MTKIENKKHINAKRLIFGLVLFGISMAFFESAVVVYLREISYSKGFSFPMNPIPDTIAVTEIIRELASLVMILAVAYLAGKSFLQRFANFLFIFALWDIFYYVFLKLLLGWPVSLLTWDILFLIPVVWSGPVIAPILISLLMILLAGIIYKFELRFTGRYYINVKEWLILLGGAVVIFVSFIYDFMKFVVESSGNLIISPNQLNQLVLKYIPSQFNWSLFILGVAILLFSFYLIHKGFKNQFHS
jgi:hypothetical protein